MAWIKKESARETIYNSVVESILNLEYSPEYIINEGDLAHRFNCSKAPVREALASLCDAKILRNIPRYGYEIVRITYEDIREILQFRYLIEGGMLKQNYQRYDADALDKLRKINDDYEKSIRENADFWQYNADFHLTLLSFSGNMYLQELLRVSLDKLRRAKTQVEWYRRCLEIPEAEAVHHRGLIQSLQDKDISAALASLRSDLSEFCELDYDVGDFL